MEALRGRGNIALSCQVVLQSLIDSEVISQGHATSIWTSWYHIPSFRYKIRGVVNRNGAKILPCRKSDYNLRRLSSTVDGHLEGKRTRVQWFKSVMLVNTAWWKLHCTYLRTYIGLHNACMHTYTPFNIGVPCSGEGSTVCCYQFIGPEGGRDVGCNQLRHGLNTLPYTFHFRT